MAQLTKAAFDALYANSSGNFPDQTIQSISPAIMRQEAKDIEDSCLFILDGFNPDINYYEQNDWLGITSALNFTVDGGGGSVVNTTGTGNESVDHSVGVVTAATGTGTTGYGYWTTNLQNIIFGNGNSFSYSQRVMLSAVSDGTNRYSAYFGFGINSGGGDFTNGAYFRYTDNVNSGKIQAVTAAASTRTATDTGITPVGGTFNIFKIVVDPAVASVKFYIDGNLVATNTTNIPSLGVTMVMGITKSLGTTSRKVFQDWYSFALTRTAVR